MTPRYTIERHACSSKYFIRVTETGFIIDSAMSLEAAIAWVKENGNRGA